MRPLRFGERAAANDRKVRPGRHDSYAIAQTKVSSGWLYLSSHPLRRGVRARTTSHNSRPIGSGYGCEIHRVGRAGRIYWAIEHMQSVTPTVHSLLPIN